MPHDWDVRELRPALTPSWLDWSSDAVDWAITSADRGSLRELADLADTMLRDERIRAKLNDRALGVLSLPMFWEGDAAVVDPAKGEPGAGRWLRIAPEAVSAKAIGWGLLMGVCPLKKRWRKPSKRTGGLFEPSLEFWHPRDLTQQTDAWGRRTWHMSTVEGVVKIEPGSDWVLYMPYGPEEPWRNGLVNCLAKPWIAKIWATEDLTRASEMTPALVALTQGLGEEGRIALQRDLERAGRNTRIVLDVPEGTKGDIKSVDFGGAAQASTQERAITISNDAIDVAIVGQLVTTSGTTGFGTGNVNAGVARTLVNFTEATWSTCMSQQVVAPYLELATGCFDDSVIPRWDPTTVEERKAQADAVTAIAGAVDALDAKLIETGERVDIPALVRSLRIPTTSLPDASTMPQAEGAAIIGDDAASADESAMMAHAMTSAGYVACPHGKKTRCPVCGVAAVKRPDAAAPGGWAVSWRPTRQLAPAALPAAPAAPAPAMLRRTAMAGRLAASTGGPKHTVKCAVDFSRLTMAGEPPTEIQIFVWGDNPTDKGVYVLDRDGAKQLLDSNNGRRIAFDLEHRSLIPLERQRPGDDELHGYGTPVQNEEGIGLVDIHYLDSGLELIKSGKKPCLSPTFDYDAERRIIGLVNVALVGQPAMHNPPTLIAASRGLLAATGEDTPMDWNAIAAVLGPYLGVDPAEASAEVWIKALTTKIAATPAVAPPPAPAVAPPPAPAVAAAAPAPAVASATLSVADALEVAQRAALSTRLDNLERDGLIRDNRAKIPDALMSWARAIPPAVLREFLSKATPIPGYVEALGGGDASQGRASTSTAADSLDVELTASFGTDPARVARIRENLSRSPDERRRAAVADRAAEIQRTNAGRAGGN